MTRCTETVHDKYSFRGRQCSKPAAVERDGRMYCKVHDPEAIKARRDASYAKWKAENARQFSQKQFERAAVDAIQQIANGHNDPRALAQSIMATKP